MQLRIQKLHCGTLRLGSRAAKAEELRQTEYPDIIFAYGFSDEYRFQFHLLLAFPLLSCFCLICSKILSLVASFFAAAYVTKWKEFFPQRKLEYDLSFSSKVVTCASPEVLQVSLAWRQQDCHAKTQYETCFWMLVKSGKTISETQEVLKVCRYDYVSLFSIFVGTCSIHKQQKNELLFQKFGINYKTLPELFRQGSCLFKTKADAVDFGCAFMFTGGVRTTCRSLLEQYVYSSCSHSIDLWHGDWFA
ncbi:hypothetical protein Bca101_020124 [Brassica carinata]